MKYNIRGENLEVTPALREYVEKKVGRLEKYLDIPSTNDAYVTMKVHKDSHNVEVTIPMSKLTLRAEESNQDMYASIDLVIEKLERQIRKHKTKISRQIRDTNVRELAKPSVPAIQVVNADEDEDDDLPIVRTKRFNLKPMDAEEAVLQMDMLGHNFFVFANAQNNQVNVVYKRKDGKYGLIEPK
jgi:putative sigma-54 modulation protein